MYYFTQGNRIKNRTNPYIKRIFVLIIKKQQVDKSVDAMGGVLSASVLFKHPAVINGQLIVINGEPWHKHHPRIANANTAICEK